MYFTEQTGEDFVAADVVDERIQQRAGDGDAGFFLTEGDEQQSVVPTVIGKFHFIHGSVAETIERIVVRFGRLGCGSVARAERQAVAFGESADEVLENGADLDSGQSYGREAQSAEVGVNGTALDLIAVIVFGVAADVGDENHRFAVISHLELQAHIGYVAEIDITSYREAYGNGNVVYRLNGEIEARKRLNDLAGVIAADEGGDSRNELAHIEYSADGIVDENFAVEFKFPLILAERLEVLVEILLISKFAVEAVANSAADGSGFEDVDLAESYIYIMDLEREVEHAHRARNSEHHVVARYVAVRVGYVHDFGGNGELRLVIIQSVNAVLVAFEGVRLAAEKFGDRNDELIGKLFTFLKRLLSALGRIHIVGRVEVIVIERIVEQIVHAAFAGVLETEIVMVVDSRSAHVREFGGKRFGRLRACKIGVRHFRAYKEVRFVFAHFREQVCFGYRVERFVAEVIGFHAAYVERRQSFAVGYRHQHAISHSVSAAVVGEFDRDIRLVGEFAREGEEGIAYLILSVNGFARVCGIGETEPRNDGVKQQHRVGFGISRIQAEGAARIIDYVTQFLAVGNTEHIRLNGIADIRVSGVERIGIRVAVDHDAAQERRSRSDSQVIVVYELVNNRGSIAEIGYRHVDIVPFGIGYVYGLLIVETESQRERVLHVVEVDGYFAELLFEGEVEHFRENGLKRRARDYYGNSALGELQTVEQSEIPVYRYGFFFILVIEIVPVSVAFRTFVSVGVSGSVGRSFDVGALLGSFLVAASEQTVKESAQLCDKSVERGNESAYGIAERSAKGVEQFRKVKI